MLDTTIAGSLPKPDWLAEPEKLWAAWRLEGQAPSAPRNEARQLRGPGPGPLSAG